MKKKIKHIEEHRKAFEIEIPSAQVKKRMDELYEKIAKTASVPGFRPGKAPRDLLERHYGEGVTKDVVEDLISESYHKALEEEGLIPLGLPQISDIKLDEARTLFFKAEFNIRPKIDLKPYKGLRLNKKKIEIKEEDIEKSIKTLQESSAKFKDAQNRPVQVGDYIVCDSEIFIDGKSISKKRENIWMPIEEKSYIPNLSKGLIGANLNEEKEIEAILPGDFPSKEHVNKKAIFKIKVKEIKERVLSKIDDEFAKDLGYNNLPELEDSVKKVLENQAERQIKQDLEHQVIERLLGDSNFNIPNALAEEQLAYLFEEEKQRLLKQGLKEEDIKIKENDLKDKLRPIAAKQIRTMFILDEIAAKEKMNVSKDELEEAFEGVARQYNQPKEKIEKYYRDNDLVSNLRADIRNAKLLEFLIKEARLEEI